ncbi:MAG TPA: hypothetical protein VNT20_08020 [Flavisolibacter sp.]|jgi:hypothetical protein|nr:hypothetical protein [Flavisolibacter sp.]
MTLKYQSEIDDLKLQNCPSNVSPPNGNIEAYRFSFDPIEHPDNFLPNVKIDRIKSAPFNYDNCTPEEKCLRCASSFYLSEESALKKWKKLPVKFKENYGYTHLAYGTINKEDGLMSSPEKEHFSFYQNEKSELEQKFKNIRPL